MKKDEHPSLLLAAAATGFLILLVIVWKIARAIGADFQLTFGAVGSNIVVLAVVGVAWWFIRFSYMLAASLVAAGSWPCWFRVLDSVAIGGGDPSTSFFVSHSDSWLSSGWLQYGGEVVLIGLVMFAVLREGRDGY